MHPSQELGQVSVLSHYLVLTDTLCTKSVSYFIRMIIQLDTLLLLSNVKQIENIESALSELIEKYIELVPVFFHIIYY